MSDATRAAQENVQRARADLGETIDALKQKLSVKELVSEVQVHLGGSEAASNLMKNFSRQAQDNPMALALVGAGLAWLFMGKGASTSGRPIGYGSSGASSYGYRYDGGHGLPGSEGLSKSVGDAASSVRHSAEDLAGRASSAATGTRDAVADASHRAMESTTHAAEQIGRLGEDMLEQYPLVVGAAAVAIGAAIGAALPRTTFEDQQLGEASRQMKHTLAEQGEHAMQRGAEVASKVKDAASREAEAQGLMPDAKSGDGSTIAERLQKVGREAANTARGELDQDLSKSEEAVRRGGKTTPGKTTP